MTAEDRYDSLIKYYSDMYMRDPRQIKKQIRQESGFNPRAKSPVGAEGLMQFMPGTWKDLNKLATYIPDVMNPEASIRCGCQYMHTLEKEFGSLDKALAAYNWGSGNVHRLDNAFNWIDGLPKETKKYVEVCMDYVGEVVG